MFKIYNWESAHPARDNLYLGRLRSSCKIIFIALLYERCMFKDVGLASQLNSRDKDYLEGLSSSLKIIAKAIWNLEIKIIWLSLWLRWLCPCFRNPKSTAENNFRIKSWGHRLVYFSWFYLPLLISCVVNAIESSSFRESVSLLKNKIFFCFHRFNSFFLFSKENRFSL